MFNPWRPRFATSLAFRIFKKHHTQLNHFYWAHRTASNKAYSSIGNADKSQHSTTIFSLPQADIHRINYDLNTWISNYEEYENWVRLSCAVALCSYLEIYLKQIVTLAISSDPGVLIGVPNAISGVTMLKRGNKFAEEHNHKIIDVIKGPWSGRINNFKNLFGRIPQIVEDNTGDLDQLRTLRNGVGHVFGRHVDEYADGVHFQIKPMLRLSEKRLKKWLGIVDAVVTTVDEQLLGAHIGSFEFFTAYHHWDHQYDKGRLNEGQGFKKYLINQTGHTIGYDFVPDLINYYRRA